MIVRRKTKNQNEQPKNIIKAVEFPDMVFNSKADLFEHLKSESSNLIGIKTAAIKNSECLEVPLIELKDSASKSDFEAGYVYPIINTTKYMDSHNDVHLDGIWKKSVKEQQNKIYYVADHELKLSSIIAHPKDVNVSTKVFTWKELGRDLEGTTEALMFKISEDKIKNSFAKDIINEKQPIQHSVRMQYVKVELAMNSESKEDKAYKKTFDKYVDEVSNKEKAIENGYFWAVSEAKIFKEGSMLPFGSNDVTPMIYPTSEPLKNTPSESVIATQKEEEKTKRRKFL